MGSEDVAVGEIAGAKDGCSKMNRSLERFIRTKYHKEESDVESSPSTKLPML
jgi:hypothetical protein